MNKHNFIIILIGIMSIGILLRSIISLYSYSGYNNPPMYGDYEAQRHWQEITINLPITDWYQNTTENDLLYWGLDYPPLTAYHSFVIGKFANYLNETYTKLSTSRGITDENHKTFMRTTVLMIDILFYVPVLILCCKGILEKLYKNNMKSNFISSNIWILYFIIPVLYPGQILIDNGHFQYNNLSLGLATFAITCLCYDKHKLGSLFFVMALNYKQMELYHAIPFFCYLLAECFQKNKHFINGIVRLCKIGITVLLTFAIIWMPWLIHSRQSTLQVIHRIFPIGRGVFEDKVANIWCIVNIFIKIRDNFQNDKMAIICLTLTLASLLPSSVNLLMNPTKKKFLISLINCSLSFFLFSFQVHEKSILLVTLPIALYFPFEPIICLWFLQISTFSMLPLLMKDNLIYPFLIVNLIYLSIIKLVLECLVGNDKIAKLNKMDILNLKLLDNTNITNGKNIKTPKTQVKTWNIQNIFINLFYLSTIGMVILLICILYVPTPVHLPHLYPLLISAYSCGHFLLFFIYFNIKQLLYN